jgi:hypothetical protein
MIRPTLIIACMFLVVVAAAAPAPGRTIELSDADADRIAVIGPEAPRLSWAAFEAAPGMFVNSSVNLRPKASLLIRVPLDKIPAGSRIARAEWILRPIAPTAGEPKLYVWRVLGEWGPGVCYQYRMVRPKKVEWTQPGGRAGASDRSERPTVSAKCTVNEEVVLNVTQDVELWHSGGAPNNGWMFTVEDNVQLRLPAPAAATRGSWKLRITYEPK